MKWHTHKKKYHQRLLSWDLWGCVKFTIYRLMELTSFIIISHIWNAGQQTHKKRTKKSLEEKKWTNKLNKLLKRTWFEEHFWGIINKIMIVALKLNLLKKIQKGGFKLENKFQQIFNVKLTFLALNLKV